MQTSTRGGCRETEQKALAVIPWIWSPLLGTVITVTPLAKRPRAERKSAGVTTSTIDDSWRGKPVLRNRGPNRESIANYT